MKDSLINGKIVFKYPDSFKATPHNCEVIENLV